MGRTSHVLVILMLILPLFSFQQDGSVSATARWQEKVDPWLLEATSSGPAEFLIYLNEQADLNSADRLPTRLEKGTYVYQTLSRLAARTQGPLIQALEAQGVTYRSYWVANMIWVRGEYSLVQSLAQRSDVAHLYANPSVRMDEPVSESRIDLSSTNAIEWNILKVNADDVWNAGFTGQGVVIGGQDTGYQWDHPALINQYQGWNGSSADHNYSWHDAIHSNFGSNPCGYDSPVPCDDNSHGTHTMGILVGDDGAGHQIGMAPGARWIGCRNMDNGIGTPATYSECFQWFIAPTDLNDQNPNPSKAPDVINNSWSCPPSEGCTDPNVLLAVVNNVRAAGILTVQSAGNGGLDCSKIDGTINAPAAIYDSSYTVGNTTASDGLSLSSSRGPVTVDGSFRMKPDVSAPGTGINSSVPTTFNLSGYGSKSGTSMAAPHVAGLAALLISSKPDLRGQTDALENHINATAVPVTLSIICPQVPGNIIPNNYYGWGRIDAWAAYQAIIPGLTLQKTTSAASVSPGSLLTYTLSVTNTQIALPATGILLTDTIPANTSFVSATGPYLLNNNLVEWSFASLDGGATFSVNLVVQVKADNCNPIENTRYGVMSDQIPEPILGLVVSTPIINPFKLTQDHFAIVVPGQVITFTHTLQNTGMITGTVALRYTSSLGWASADLPATASLAPGDPFSLPIRVEVPVDALFGSVEETTLVASCSYDPPNQVSNTDRSYYQFPIYYPMVKYWSP